MKKIYKRKKILSLIISVLLIVSLAGLLKIIWSNEKGIQNTALDQIISVSRVIQLTGENSPSRTDQYMVYGTDLGSIFTHGERIYFIFGDTFGTRYKDHIGPGGEMWRSNTMGYTHDKNASNGIIFDGMIVNSTGIAKQLIPSSCADNEITKIPTAGISVNGNIYLYYMSLQQWGDHGHWDANYCGVAKSTDNGENFMILENPRWPGGSNFIQTTIAPFGDYLYFWSIPSGRFGGVQIMRVRSEKIESQDAYEYLSGFTGQHISWTSNHYNAITIVEQPVGELSVIWNEYLGRWIMTYLNEKSYSIELREAVNPWGPWSKPFELASGINYPGLYGAFMHPIYTEDNGRVLYFTMSQWAPYNVFLMRAELQKK